MKSMYRVVKYTIGSQTYYSIEERVLWVFWIYATPDTFLKKYDKLEHAIEAIKAEVASNTLTKKVVYIYKE